MEQGSEFHQFAGAIILLWFFIASYVLSTDWEE